MTEAEKLLAEVEAYMGSDACVRDIEWRRDVLAASDSFEAYWASTASASVIRDYRAGRVVNG